MTELTPDNFKRMAENVTALAENVTGLGKDMSALDKALGEVKGSIDGLKQAHNVLTASAGLVGALFLAALVYVGTQVGGLDTRVDGVIKELGGVQGELKAINQRLMVLEEIRDRIERLASVEQKPAAGGAVEAPDDPFIASTDGVVFAGDIAPSELVKTLEALLARHDTVRMVGTDAPAGQTKVIYSSAGLAAGWRMVQGSASSLSFKKVGTIQQFTESVERQAEESPEEGVLLISTSDPSLRDIAGQYGVNFNR